MATFSYLGLSGSFALAQTMPANEPIENQTVLHTPNDKSSVSDKTGLNSKTSEAVNSIYIEPTQHKPTQPTLPPSKQNLANNQAVKDKTPSQKSNNKRVTLQPTFVGVFVNGQEQTSLDAYYDVQAGSDKLANIHSVQSKKEGDRHKVAEPVTEPVAEGDTYFLELEDVERLTAIEFKPSADPNFQYDVKTPIGDTHLTPAQIYQHHDNPYADNNHKYKELLGLSVLKSFGINAIYNQQDLAILLNMGWQPKKVREAKHADNRNQQQIKPIDYYPSKAGLLGLSVNSDVSLNQNKASAHIADPNPNNAESTAKPTIRQETVNLGAYGYALGGMWGVDATGSQNNTLNQNNDDQHHFSDSILQGLTHSPWQLSKWNINNVYWAKAGNKFATRLGVNQSNGLGQGSRVSGLEFSGAMIAYSNQDIARHIADFDQNSRSLLQNTSHNYQIIEGSAHPGGVAELRINGRTVARVQIGLDGRYEFVNLDVEQLNLIDISVEIAIFEYPLAQQPLEVRPIFLGKRRSSVATGEMLIEAGAGSAGNIFNDASSNDAVAHLYAEYGLNNRTAIRAGLNSTYNAQHATTLNAKIKHHDLSWYTGINFVPTPLSNADLSYAHSPAEDSWQLQWSYLGKKLNANYLYFARQYTPATSITSISQQTQSQTNELEQAHYFSLDYRPNLKTSIGINQYYNKGLKQKLLNAQPYHIYTSVNHRFNEVLNAGVNWHSLGDRYSYHIHWRDVATDKDDNSKSSKTDGQVIGGRNALSLSGDKQSETMTLGHTFSDQMHVNQSIRHLHGADHLLFQGDINYRFKDDFFSSSRYNNADKDQVDLGSNDSIRSQLSLGYSLYDGHFGWQADWQINHKNGVNFSFGYQHRYIGNIPMYNDNVVYDPNIYNPNDLNTSYVAPNYESLDRADRNQPWAQENYIYARLSLDMFKAPSQPLRLGRAPVNSEGNVMVTVHHAAEPVLDVNTIRFSLDDQMVRANLLNTQPHSSQYIIPNIKAGEYTLALDAKNLPIEYSTSSLATPYIKVSKYAPTAVPIKLQKTYGISAKLADNKEGVDVGVYLQDELIQTVQSGSYGYFQLLGLASDVYTLKAKGYQSQKVTINDDFVMQIELQPKGIE